MSRCSPPPDKRQRDERGWRLLADSVSDVIWASDFNLKLTYISPSVEQLLGFTPDEAVRKTLEETMTSQSARLASRVLRQEMAREASAATQPRGQRSLELEMKRKDGSTVWMEHRVSFLRSEDGGAAGLVGVARDITRQREALQALRDGEEKYRSLIERAIDGITIVQDGVFKLVNHSAAAMMGYSEEELTGMEFARLLPPARLDELVKRYQRRIAGAEGQSRYETQLVHKNGELVDVEIDAGLIQYEGKTADLAFARDITQRKRVEQTLLAYQQGLRYLASQLSLAEERQKRKIAIELHDAIAQELAFASLELDRVQKSLRPDEPAFSALRALRETLGRIIRETRTLIFEISPPVLYEQGLEGCLEWLAERATQRSGVAVEVRADNCGPSLDQDCCIFLFQVVRELIANVEKHAQATRARIGLTKADNGIEVMVEDDGVGFDVAELDSDTARQRHTFGLVSVRERVQSWGGRLHVASNCGQGTRAAVWIPLTARS